MTVKILKNLLVCASLGLSIQASSFAAEPGSVATISGAEGTVMVDHGKGFVTSKVDAPLFENDRVITLDGSLAEITYTDGCRTKLKSNNLIVISIDPGCKAAILDATKAGPGSGMGGTHVALLGPAAASSWAAYIPPLGGAGIAIAIVSISAE